MYETMLKFAPQKLSDEFSFQYIFDYGEKKFQKILDVLQDSQKIKDYLNDVIASSVTPSPDGLQILLNSHSYFIFAKEETVCMGCIVVINMWESKLYIKTNSIYNGKYDHFVTKIITNMILHCHRLKYVKSNNTFTKFFEILREIEMSAEK